MRQFSFVILVLLLLCAGSGCSSKQVTGLPDQALSLPAENGCIVLNYHRIRNDTLFLRTVQKLSNNSELNLYSVYTNDFEKQLLYLKDNGVQFVTARELEQYITKEKTIEGKCAHVTFDDIDSSVYERAFPILKKERIPFSVYVIMGEIGNPDFANLRLVTWEQLDEMKRSGLAEIGTHTYSLHYLEDDMKPAFLKEENLKLFQKDALQAKQVYREHFGENPKYFAYPYGFGIPVTDYFMKSEGYHLLFSLSGGLVKPGSSTNFVKRILVTDETWNTIREWIDET